MVSNGWGPTNGTVYVAVSDNSVGFDDGTVWSCWVDYVDTSTSLQVRLSRTPTHPATARVQANVNLYTVLGQSSMYLSFGAASSATVYSVPTIRSWTCSLNSDYLFNCPWVLARESNPSFLFLLFFFFILRIFLLPFLTFCSFFISSFLSLSVPNSAFSLSLTPAALLVTEDFQLETPTDPYSLLLNRVLNTLGNVFFDSIRTGSFSIFKSPSASASMIAWSVLVALL